MGTAATFRRHPINDLIGIHDVTRFAMYAVRCVNLELLAVGSASRIDDLIDIGGAKARAGISIFFKTTRTTQFRVLNE